MKLESARAQLAEWGRQMSREGLCPGTSGNLSVYDPAEGCMAVTPSGVSCGAVTPEDIVVMDLDGRVLEGERKPSSEWALHAILCRRHPAARAVVHTHSVYCTTLAVLGLPIRPVHYAAAAAGVREVPCAPYRLFGTRELAEQAAETCGDGRAVLLGNHGLVVWGEDLPGACALARDLEFVARLQWQAMAVGTPSVLTEEEMDRAMGRFRTYGQGK